MAITYNPATNIILITGYSEVTPCTFTDLYNADKAGTYSLHARVGIAGVDGAAVAVTNALRPTDYVILGGTTGDLYITITNWNLMTNATIDVIGTDRDGNAQTDSVVVNANGNFNTALWFATITHTQVTVFNTPGGGSFDYDLTQGQWGRIWNQGAQFYIEAYMEIGIFDSTAGHFGDEQKHVEFSAGLAPAGPPGWSLMLIELLNLSSSTFRLGRIMDASLKLAERGCALMIRNPDNTCSMLSEEYYPCSATVVASHFTARSAGISIYDADYWHNYHDNYVWFEYITNSDIFNHTCCNTIGVRRPVNTTVEKLSVFADKDFCPAVYFQGATGTARDLYGRGVWTASWRRKSVECEAVGAAVDCYIINGDLNVWSFGWSGATRYIYRQYDFDLRVVDATGTGISGATVVIEDVNGAAVAGSPFTTDANGDIATPTLNYGTYESGDGSTPTLHTPHTVTISKAGYITRTIVYTMDRKREEIEKLGGAAPHGREYRRRRYPGEVSILDEYE